VAEYYTAESIRKQIIRIGNVDNTFGTRYFPDDWEYCPCHLAELKHCVNGRCLVRIAIFFNDPNIGLSTIEIIYLKDKKHGYVRADQMKIKALVDHKLINIRSLETVVI